MSSAQEHGPGDPSPFEANDAARVDELLVAAGRGDEHAFGLFYDHVVGAIVDRVRSVLGDPVRAEDVTHEILVEVWRTAGSYSPDQGEAASWAMALAQRRATEQLIRSAAVGNTRKEHAATGTAFVRETPGRAATALAQLTQLQREVLLRVQRQGQTYRDVGGAMGISVSEVRALAHDAVTLLRDVLAVATSAESSGLDSETR